MALNIEKIKTQLKKLNWSDFRTELDASDMSAEVAERVLGLLLRADSMVRRHPNDDGAARDTFLAQFGAYLQARGADGAAAALMELHGMFKTIDKGFVAIYDMERRLPSASLTSVQLIAGLFKALDIYAKDIDRDIANASVASPVLTFERRVKDPAGHEYDSGAVFHGLTIAATDILLMEGWRENYFNGDDSLVLPQIGAASEDADNLVKAKLANAHTWRDWKNIDERTRFLGGKLKVFETPFPEWVQQVSPADVLPEMAFEFEPNIAAEQFDVLANERLDRRFTQNLGEMMQQTNLLALVAAQGAIVPLPPAGLLSIDELHAGVMLTQSLTLPLCDTYAGKLLLSERLRGYATLKQYVPALEKAQATHFARVGRQELLAELTRCGLTKESAEEFIDLATFRRSSRDLYDQPLIRLDDGRFIVFGFSLLHADLCKTVLSSLSNEGQSFQERGISFEQSMIKLIEENGFKARTLTVTRGPECAEYDYDVTFVWGDYVFFVECKNRSIPGGNPVAIFNFNNDMRAHHTQVQRLRQGLVDYPDILERNYPEAIGKTPIFCVLSSLPFSKGLEDDIYFIDESLLGRFFKNGGIGFTVGPLRPAPGESVERSEFHRIWSGSQPTVEDFLRYIKEPPQLKISAASHHLSSRVQWLSDKVVAAIVDFARKDLSPEDIASALAR